MDLRTDIQTILRRSGLSSRELAKRAGVSHLAVWKFLNDQGDLKLNTLQALTRTFGCEIDLRQRDADPSKWFLAVTGEKTLIDRLKRAPACEKVKPVKRARPNRLAKA